MRVTIYYSVPTVSSRQRDRNQLCSLTSHVQIEITQQIMFALRWLLVEFLPKIDNSGNVSNKGLCREDQTKFSNTSNGVLGPQVQSPLEVTLLLNLFCSSPHQPLLPTLPGSSTLGKTL